MNTRHEYYEEESGVTFLYTFDEKYGWNKIYITDSEIDFTVYSSEGISDSENIPDRSEHC